MNKKTFFAKRMLELELGRYFGPQYLQFFLILGVFIKTYFKNMHLIMYILIFSIAIIAIWLLGYFLLKTGFYEKYQFESPAFKKLEKYINERDEKENKG